MLIVLRRKNHYLKTFCLVLTEIGFLAVKRHNTSYKHAGPERYRKFSIKPPGGLIDFKHSKRGAYWREGAYKRGGFNIFFQI